MLLAQYGRYSSDLQRTESITAQFRSIKQWAQRNGHEIIATYADEAVSGKNDDRPEFQKMIDDSKNAPWEGIVVHKLDRFWRNRYDAAIYKKKLKDNHKAIFYAEQNIDDSPEGIIMETMLEGMAEYYIANLAKEVKKGQKENAYECKHNGGIPLLGYDVDENLHYIINNQEAEIVRLIFNRYNNGYTIPQIIKELNSKTYKTKRGNDFGKNSIYDLLRNEKYTGVYTFGYGSKKSRKRNNPNIDMIRTENGMPAIISKEVFEMAKSRMRTNKGGSGKAKHVYLLTGLMFCGECGEGYIGHTSNNHSRYGCKKRINKVNCDNIYIDKNKIERYIIDNLFQTISSEVTDELVEKVNKEYIESRNELKESLNTSRNELNGIEIKIRNIINAISNGIINTSLKNELDILENKKKFLEEKISILNSMSSIKKIDREIILKAVAKDISNRVEDNT